MKVIIRRATPADIPAAQVLEQKTFSSHAISPRQMRYLLQSPGAVFLVARRAGDLAGDAIGLVRRHVGGRISGRIYSVVVDPAHRGQKIGKKLTTALMRALHERGARRVFLEVDHSNQGAINLYESLGFKTVRPLHHYYGRGKHGVHMRHED